MNNVDPLKVARVFMDDRYGSLGTAKDQDKWLEKFGYTIDAMTFLVEAQTKEPALNRVIVVQAQERLCVSCVHFHPQGPLLHVRDHPNRLHQT